MWFPFGRKDKLHGISYHISLCGSLPRNQPSAAQLPPKTDYLLKKADLLTCHFSTFISFFCVFPVLLLLCSASIHVFFFVFFFLSVDREKINDELPRAICTKTPRNDRLLERWQHWQRLELIKLLLLICLVKSFSAQSQDKIYFCKPLICSHL